MTRSYSLRLLANISILHQLLQPQHRLAALLKVHNLERRKRGVVECLEANIPSKNNTRSGLISGRAESQTASCQGGLGDELLDDFVLLKLEKRAADV
jgi:hypothetical protein